MIINFFLFYSFVFLIFVHGVFFNKIYYKFLGVKKVELNFFTSIFFGLFSLSFISLLFNFFINLNSFFFKSFFIFLIVLSFIKVEIKNYKIFFKNTLLIFLISPLLNFMPEGYDAALYHFPHQTWIREEKIIFGLTNIHDRFGLISLYNYLAANLWFNNTFIALSYLQGTYYLLFFSFLFFLLNLKAKSSLWIVLSTIFTLPILIRYIEPSYGLVDAPYGFLFYIVIMSGLVLLREKKTNDSLVILFIFASCFVFTLKPSGILIFPYTFLILIVLSKYKKVNLSNKIYLKTFLFSFFITSSWVIKNIINTSCIVYPIQSLCFDFPWSDLNHLSIINQAIKYYHYQYYNSINFIYLKDFISGYWYFSLFLALFFIFAFVVSFKIKFTKLYNVKFIILLLLFASYLFLYTYSTRSLKGFAYSSQLHAEYASIMIFKEFFMLILIFIISILFSSIFLNKDLKFIKINNFIFFIPLFYLIFCFIIWLLIAPSPRLAFGYFVSLASVFILAFVKDNFLYTNKISNLIKNFIYLFVFVLFFFEPLYKNINKLNLNTRKIPKIETIKREGFGVKADYFCWTEKNCYFYNYDIKLNYLFFNYKIFTK